MRSRKRTGGLPGPRATVAQPKLYSKHGHPRASNPARATSCAGGDQATRWHLLGLTALRLGCCGSAPAANGSMRSIEPSSKQPLQTARVLEVDGIIPTLASICCGSLFLAIAAMSAADGMAAGPSVSMAPTAGHRTTRGHKSCPADGMCQDFASMHRPVLYVSFAWAALYYCFLQAQAASTFWVHQRLRKEATSSPASAPAPPWSSLAARSVKATRHGLIFCLDRAVGNMLEQSPPFLLSMWLYSAVVSPLAASRLGWLWLLLRACYPLAFAQRPVPSSKLGVSLLSIITWPSYAIIWAMFIGTLSEVALPR